MIKDCGDKDLNAWLKGKLSLASANSLSIFNSHHSLDFFAGLRNFKRSSRLAASKSAGDGNKERTLRVVGLPRRAFSLLQSKENIIC